MSGVPDDVRARQARVRKMIESGESVQGEISYVPDAATLAAANGSRDHSHERAKQNSRSPSNSHNDADAAAPDAASPPADAMGVKIEFQKEEVASVQPAPHGAPPRSVQPSTLAQQLQLARSGLDDSNFPRSASMAIHKYTVYLGYEEGAMVQIATMANATAHELVKEALRAAAEDAGGELPIGLLADPWSYRVYVAEEDGEVDTDFPPLDARTNVAQLGVDTFVLRDRVDAAIPAQGRPASNSVVPEGPGASHGLSGEDHSNNSRGGGFKSLETDGEERKQIQETQPSCCDKCVVQ